VVSLSSQENKVGGSPAQAAFQSLSFQEREESEHRDVEPQVVSLS